MKKYLLIVLFCSLGISGYALTFGQTETIQPIDSNECGASRGTTTGPKTITVSWPDNTTSSGRINCVCACGENGGKCEWNNNGIIIIKHPHNNTTCHAVANCTSITYRNCGTGSTASSTGSSSNYDDTQRQSCIEGEKVYTPCGTNNTTCGTQTTFCIDGSVGMTNCEYLRKPPAISLIETVASISGGGGVSSSVSVVSSSTTSNSTQSSGGGTAAGTTVSSTTAAQQQVAQQNTTQNQGYQYQRSY